MIDERPRHESLKAERREKRKKDKKAAKAQRREHRDQARARRGDGDDPGVTGEGEGERRDLVDDIRRVGSERAGRKLQQVWSQDHGGGRGRSARLASRALGRG